MKRQFGKVSMTVYAGFALVLVACQNEPINVRQARYQLQAGESLKKLTARYSRAFSSSTSGRKGYQDFNNFGSNPWGGQMFHPQVEDAAAKCVQMLQSVPPTRHTYARAMVTVARCLNRIIEERNFLLTWGYQQGNQSMQSMWGYGQAWPQWAPYQQQYGQQYHAQFNPFLNQGWWPNQGQPYPNQWGGGNGGGFGGGGGYPGGWQPGQ